MLWKPSCLEYEAGLYRETESFTLAIMVFEHFFMHMISMRHITVQFSPVCSHVSRRRLVLICAERPTDAKSEIIQFLQDQARQLMLLKRSAAEADRRTRSGTATLISCSKRGVFIHQQDQIIAISIVLNFDDK